MDYFFSLIYHFLNSCRGRINNENNVGFFIIFLYCYSIVSFIYIFGSNKILLFIKIRFPNKKQENNIQEASNNLDNVNDQQTTNEKPPKHSESQVENNDLDQDDEMNLNVKSICSISVKPFVVMLFIFRKKQK